MVSSSSRLHWRALLPIFFDHHQVVRDYYPSCAEIVRKASGAGHVVAFDHNVRSAAGKKAKKRIKGGQEVQGPSRVVHGDYTLTSAPQRLRDLTKPPSLNDSVRLALAEGESLLASDAVERALAQGRFAIINLWRNIADEPVETHPLALCDATSVRPEDLVVFEIHYHDRIGENYFAKYASDHEWFFYPSLTRKEALLIKHGAPPARSPGPMAPCLTRPAQTHHAPSVPTLPSRPPLLGPTFPSVGASKCAV